MFLKGEQVSCVSRSCVPFLVPSSCNPDLQILSWPSAFVSHQLTTCLFSRRSFSRVPFLLLTFVMTHGDLTLIHILLLSCFPLSTGLIKALCPFMGIQPQDLERHCFLQICLRQQVAIVCYLCSSFFLVLKNKFNYILDSTLTHFF